VTIKSTISLTVQDSLSVAVAIDITLKPLFKLYFLRVGGEGMSGFEH
jgi:hypothetical protein